MAALTVNQPIAASGGDCSVRLPLSASVVPFIGSILVLEADGYVNRLAAASKGAIFAGISIERIEAVQHPVSGAADGDLSVMAQVGAFVAELTISGVARDDVAHNRRVYATDEQTFSLTDTEGTLIGRVIGLKASGVAYVLCATAGHQGIIEAGSRFRGIKTMAATGTQDLSTFDLGKLIIVPNTAALTLTLPLAADAAGESISVMKTTAAGAGTAVTVDGNGAETINGSATHAALDAQYDIATYTSTGTAWLITDAAIA